jgi:serine/threonine protein kinase
MALTKGMKLGAYELSGPIGAGGMGEVYRARDPRLKRDVAIKIVPAAFCSDPQRLRRFEQEAHAAAALNHPNILAVYDIGSENGTPYIVSELLEGETLRERLRSEPLPIRKAVDYALQLARGLAAAHEKGIVHRDLKPENIFITRDGRVKLLDFGLAKLLPASHAHADGETRTIQSDAGTVLGTVGYMSPEQVRGQAGDARSDLFAFGAVLYEMISGKRAFHGETPADTMSAILHSDPPELIESNRLASPAMERIVRHCLEKAPEQRFQSAHDLAFDLETLTNVSGTEAAVRAHMSRPRGRIIVGVIVVLLLVALGAFLLGKIRPTLPQSARFHRITYERGSIISARFSADGHSVIYDAAWEGKPAHLFSTPPTSPEPRPVDLDNAHLFAVSKDGEAAVGLGGQVSNHQQVVGATLARSPLGGGAPRPLAQDVWSADWGPDGSMAIARTVGGRTRLEYPMGKVLYETSGWISYLRFSPSGDRIAFLDHRYWPDDRGWVAVVDLQGNKKTLSGEWESEDGLAWTPDGKEIWFAATQAGIDRSLYGVTLAGKQRLVLSVPVSLRLYDIYRDGRVLLSAGHERVHMAVAAPDNRSRDVSWSGWTIATDISPDGKWVLFSEQSEFAGPNYIVALRGTDGSPPIKLGDGTGWFSPDAKWVTAIMPGDPTHATLLPTGVGDSRVIPVTGLQRLQQIAYIPDGRLMLVGAQANHGVRCFLRREEDGPLQPITAEGTRNCRVSPDSRYAVASNLTGISVYPIDGGEARVLPDSAGMLPIQWADNHSILAFTQGELPSRVFRIDTTNGKRQLVRELVPGDLAGVSQLQTVVTTPNASSFVYSYQQALYELYVVEGLK